VLFGLLGLPELLSFAVQILSVFFWQLRRHPMERVYPIPFVLFVQIGAEPITDVIWRVPPVRVVSASETSPLISNRGSRQDPLRNKTIGEGK
jgi:hypothetical protein